MKTIPGWTIRLLKLYMAAGLVVSAIVSPPAFSFVPAVLAAVYVIAWLRPPFITANLVADLFVFFSVSILLSQDMPFYFAVLTAVPGLILVTRDLEISAETLPSPVSKHPCSPTRLGSGLLLIVAVLMATGILVKNPVLILGSGVAILYFAVLYGIVFSRFSGKPVEMDPVHERIVAGSRTLLYMSATGKMRFGGNLILESPYRWLTVTPDVLPLSGGRVEFEIALTPPLSGPSSVTINAQVLDRWGLMRTRFELVPLTLTVIPRARYAEWLARRYLTESHTGMLPLISTLGAIKPLYGLRIGVEYYGSQLYQPGDSLKNIDWKHSIKYNKLISKEFAEFRSQPAVLLVNLTAGNAEEVDRQTYNMVIVALSLAKEQIPTAVAAYDEEEVRWVTNALSPQNLVARVLEAIPQMRAIGKPVKYLGRPDIIRLRANIRRLQSVDSESARKLARVLQVEYGALKDLARTSPATRALNLAFERTGTPQSTIVIVSPLNHDTEAVMFIAGGYGSRGNATLVVEEAVSGKR
jgi:uncharacterized protein (DUF58 family)